MSASKVTTSFVQAGPLSEALNGKTVVITQNPAGTWNIVADCTDAQLTTALALVSPESNVTMADTVTVPAGKGLDTATGGALAIGPSTATSVVVTPPTTVTGPLTATAGVAGLVGSVVAAPGAVANTDTYLTSATIVPAKTLKVGSLVRITLHGTCTSSNADTGTFTIRAGTLGTTADASVATATVASSGSGSAVAFEAVFSFTVQTLGASGTAFGSMRVSNTGATGLVAVTNTVKAITSSSLATTTATKLGISYISGASTTTTTFQDCTVEVLS